MTTATPTQILFIDPAVSDIDMLLAAVDPATEIVRLSADRDGLVQIAEALDGRSDVGAVHIVSHGAPGALMLGSGTVDEASLADHATELATIREALAEGADLLLYGCNVAEGTAGRDFIAALAGATGADVAASEDTTGAGSLGGDWVLEASTGAIEAQAVQAEAYAEVLGADGSLPGGLQGGGPWNWGGNTFQTKYDGAISDNDPENPLRSGNKWDRYVLDGVAAGTRVYVYMGNSSSVDDYLQIDRNGSIITQNDDGGDGERSYDAYVTWIYQPGDVIRATTYSPGYRGSYSLYIGTSSGVAAQPTDIGNNPPPPVVPPTAPTFTDSHALIATYNDTGAADSFDNTTGTLTATDSTPTSTLRFGGGGVHTYGTLAVAANGSFVFTPDAAAINALAAGQSGTATFTVNVSDGSLSSSKQITVHVTGANDAPTLVSNAALPAVAEDAADPAGMSVEALFAPRFADADNGASLGGIVVVGDASTPLQGAWEYSTDGGSTWHAVGVVSADAGLALSAGSLLRFMPAADWNGTPGSLTVHAADDDFVGTYSNGAAHATFDTTADAATSGVSTGSRTLTTGVTAVNDAPTFDDPSAIAIALSETAATDASATLDGGSLSGTLTASDIENDALTFGIRGGTSAAGSVTKAGAFGTLTLDVATGAWTYAPTNMAGLDALAQDAVATDVFEFKVVDANGGESLKTLTVTLTGTNDQPLVDAGISDQVFDGAGSWKFQVPANAFSDAEGLGLSYTVEVVDGDGVVIDTITTADNLDTSPSAWLSFDAASRTLTGTPLDGTSLPLTFKVTATDSEGLTVSDGFELTLNPTSSGANTAIDAAPVSTNDRISVTVGDVQTLTLGDFGDYHDVEGAALAAVKITSLPDSGTLEYSADGSAWSAVTVNQEISSADITAGHLRITGGSTASAIGFEVGDGTAFSSNGYQLSVDVAQVAAAVGFADSTVSTTQAGAWTNVYDSDALTGFTGTVRVVVDASGGTVRLSSGASGVDAVTTGYGDLLDGTATSIAFEGTLAEVNAALQLLQANRGANPNVTLNVNVIAGGAAYNPDNRHYYEVVGDGTTDYSWQEAHDLAAGKTFNGLTGYLATITSAEENAFMLSKLPADAWIGASDADQEGTWKWVTGPEAGQTISIGNDLPVTQPGQYANWNELEPNNSSDDENYAEFYASSGTNPGRWNDLSGAALKYFIVEYGGMPAQSATEQASRTITLSASEPSLTVAGTAAYTENAVATVLDPALTLTDLDGHLASATVIIDSGFQSGDRLAFSNDGSTMGDIAANYNPATGVLTLASGGGATLAQWEAALKSVSFSATSDVPGASRTISWQVNDGTASSNVGTTTIDMTAVNDAPTVTHLQDVTVAPGTALNLDIGDPFSDIEGSAITYSATLADGTALPDWLSFDPTTHVFSGNPPAGTASLGIRVIGSDGSASSSTTFTLQLADAALAASAANNDGTVAITGTPTQGQTLTAGAPSDADGYTAAVTYQWQVSADNGSTWSDIAGARGQGGTLDLAESEAGKQVRVQAFYNDNGGSAEMPVSDALSIANVDAAGSASISGVLTPGETLTASISDGDGLGDATPTYQWFRDGVLINGATYSSYTLTNDDGGAHIRVDVSYTDDQGTVENRSCTTASEIQLGIIAPSAADDTGSATEASGVGNAIAGTDATGNLLGNDSDANDNIDTATPITSVRSGSAEGVGEAATLAGGVFTIAGLYGTLTVNQVTGAYSYAVNQAHDSVQALQTGQTLQDAFNYTLADLTGLSDTAALTITINGANDAPTLSDLPTAALFTEDVAEAIRSSFSLVDPDGGSSFALRLTVTHGTLRGEIPTTIPGVTITGTDTGVLTLSGTSMSAVQSWLASGQLLYTSAPNENGDLDATLTWSVQDGAGGFMDAGTTALNVTQANNAPIVDVGGADTAGNDFTTTFRPRGAEVAVVAGDITIADIDPADTLSSATVTLAAGAFDNAFGTLYETLRSSANDAFEGSLGTIAITGNGNDHNGLTGATQLVFTGAGTHADYQAALQTVLYNNSNPNAFSGDRSITISVSDAVGQASNAGSFTTAAPNALIAVGQRIFIGGVDSGFTVGQVVDSQHFVASGPLSALEPGVTLEFYGEGSLVTSGVQTGPVVATTTVQVPWTPVIDMSGETLAGRDHAVTYTEGQAGVAIAKSDASITDQDGNISSVVITLTNPQDGVAEKLFISAPLVAQLATLGITVTGNDSHAITLSGSKDATFFQIGLRGVQYANTSDHPDALTQRVVEVTSTDVDGNTGVGAQTTINLVAVNDAPTGTDGTLTVLEDTATVLHAADFGFVDVDGNDFASLTVDSLPASGALTLDGVAVTAGQVITVANIAAGKFVYTPAANVSGDAAASFGFKVQDNGGTAHGGVELDATANTITFDITPVNDAPVLTAGTPSLESIGEDDTLGAGQLVGDLVGAGAGKTGVADVDTLNNGGAGHAPEAVGQGIAIHALANDGPAAGGAWEYSTDGGSTWTAVGAVSEANALLLGATDRIRFVPDGENATTATFSYYLWDGADGTAGSKADASARGGASAFSNDGDTAAIVVTPVNDAASIDLNGADAGTDFTTIFRPRGEGVAVVGDGIAISDVDMLDAGTPDTLVSATVSIAGGALDNQFGTTFETLRSSADQAFEGSLGTIAVSGNGTGDHGLTDATSLTFTGAGTRADYEAALKTVVYDNANPNAFSGDRTIEITVRDASVSTGDTADGTDSAVATTTVQVPWTPVVDMNGDTAAGRNASVVFKEDSPGVAIAASDASIVDQDGNIASVTVTLTNPVDGVAEKLFISSSLVTQLASVGITVSGNNSHTIVLSGNRDGTVFQLALRAIQYVNTSDDADTSERVVTVASVDVQGNTGVGAQATINLTPVNDAPQGIDSAVTLDEDTNHTFAMSDFGHTDAEGDALQSVVVTTLPGAGTLTLDGVAVTAGQEIVVADIDAGKLVYTPVADANGAPTSSFTFQLRDTGGTVNGGVELDPTPNTLTLNVDPVNDAPTGSVTISGSAREGATLTANPAITDVDRTSGEIDAATTYQWQVRQVPDGTWTDVAGATASTFVPTADERNHEVRVVITYEDVDSPLATAVYDSAVAGQPAIIGDTDGNIALVLDTDEPVVIWHPQGDVTVTNTGTGPLTVDELPDGGTLTVDGSGDTTVSSPLGDLAVDNAGPGTVTVTGLPDDAEVTTSGDGDVVIDDPLGGVVLDNQSDGEVTVRGLDDGETLDVGGAGPTTVADPDGDLAIANAGPGTVTATGVNDAAVVTTSGAGPVRIDDPDGSLELVNQGPGPVTVAGIDDGEALVVGGTGSTTVENPDGDLSLTNDGTGTVTVTGAADGAEITTAGTGDVYIPSPLGDIDLVNDLTGGGDLFVNHVADGADVNVSGAGPTTVTNPLGDLDVANGGPGSVAVRCLVDGKTVTTSGDGDVAIQNPRGSVGLVNEGPGAVSVDSVNAGERVDVSGSGPTTVTNPDGDVTVSNTGTGLVTTTGASAGSTVGFEGSGPQAIDLASLPDGSAITLDNAGGANVQVLHAPDDAVVHAQGSGDFTVSAPAGDITVDNDGTGTVLVDQPADGATVTKTGTGPAVIDHPVGGFTLDNEDSGLVTVHDLDAGQTLVVEGTGPVAVESDLAAGEHIAVDTSANSNVQLSNTGAGVIDVVGDLRLDAGDPVTIEVHEGAAALTVAGAVSLAGTPLNLQLDPDYAPDLGDTITLLDNDGSDAISGTFDGLPEGAPVYVGGKLFSISYTGGSGNDVVLTRINDEPSGSVTITGAPSQGARLVASHSLADTDGMGTVRYQWLADGTLLAVGASYVVTQEAVGKAITVVASYTDAKGTHETVTSDATAPIANVNDAPTGHVLISGTPSLGQTLLASNTLADLDGMGTVSYQWQADGANIAGATGDSLAMGRSEIGKAITVVASYTDGYGAAEHVKSAPSVPVADGSGVPREVESQVPGLGGGSTGDGNGDGVKDVLQPSVASAALERDGGASSTFVTLVVDSVDGKVREGSTDRLVDFVPDDAAPDLPSWAHLPAGEIGFTAQVDAAGVTKDFSLYVDKDLGVNGYWTQNADGVLVNLASEAYGGRIVVEGDKLRLDFQITEGGEFDQGTAGDHTIVNHGAAGHAALGLIGYAVDTPVVADGVDMWD
jgi:VCBS repeat-containing protein